MCAFQANIPQPTDTLNKSQGDLLGNFQAIQTLIDVNHYDFASGNQGKHMFVSMPTQTVDPVTAGLEMALYTKSVAGTPHMYIRQQTNGAVTDITGATTGTGNDTTTLPSGVILKWGTGQVSSQKQTIPFTTPFNNIFSIIASPAKPTGGPVLTDGISITSYNVNNFSVLTDPTDPSITYTWLAIGN